LRRRGQRIREKEGEEEHRGRRKRVIELNALEGRLGRFWLDLRRDLEQQETWILGVPDRGEESRDVGQRRRGKRWR